MMSPKERERVKGYIKVLEAYLDGKTIQYANEGYKWTDIACDVPPPFNFTLAGQYRVKPEPREFYISAGYRTNNSWQAIGQGLESGEKIRVREVLDNE